MMRMMMVNNSKITKSWYRINKIIMRKRKAMNKMERMKKVMKVWMMMI